MTDPFIPSQEILDAIRAGGISKSVFHRQIPPYTLSVIYRECSAAIESPHWYPESMIFDGKWERDEQGRATAWPRIVYQGEGWNDLRAFYPLTNPEAIKAFIDSKNEAED
jgi:hypothetical protein